VLQHAEQLRDFHGVGLPFVFYTNGHKHFFWESDFYSPEKIVGFPTRDDLECVKLRWRIAAILDKADAVRRKRQQTLTSPTNSSAPPSSICSATLLLTQRGGKSSP